MSEDNVLDLPENLCAKATAVEVNDAILSKTNTLLERFKKLLAKNNDAGFILPISDLINYKETENIDYIACDILCKKISKAGYDIERGGEGESGMDLLIINPFTINHKTVLQK